MNLILPTYVFKFYNLIEFEICLKNLRVGCCLSRGDGRVGIRVLGVCIGPGAAGGGGCAGVVATAGKKFLAACKIHHILFFLIPGTQPIL